MNASRHFPVIFILLASIAFSLVKANHFGWGALPYSDAELIADGVGVVIMSIAVVVFVLVENQGKP